MARSQKPRDVPAGAQTIAVNRRARRDYDILDSIEVGIVLRGDEVKSLREAKAQLAEAWARIDGNELWVHNLHIAAYSHSAGVWTPEPLRVRKLLAHRSEILRLNSRVQQDRLALIPLSMYFVKGRAKLSLALARGRSKGDKRRELVQAEADKEAAQAMRRWK